MAGWLVTVHATSVIVLLERELSSCIAFGKKKKRGLWCLSAKDNAAFGYQVEAGIVVQFLSWEPKLQQGRVEGTLLTLLLDGSQLGESLLSVLAFVTQF